MAYSKVPNAQIGAVQKPATRVAGERTYVEPVNPTKPPVLGVGTVAAAGSTQGTAALVPSSPFVAVTAADATKGVILPVSGAGTEITIHNVANAVLKVYPPTGGDINDGSSNAAISMAAKSQGRFICADGVTWSAAFV